jgi:hypothetical protein
LLNFATVQSLRMARSHRAARDSNRDKSDAALSMDEVTFWTTQTPDATHVFRPARRAGVLSSIQTQD